MSAITPPLEYAARFAKVLAPASAKAEVLSVDTYEVFQQWDLVLAPRTGEVMRVEDAADGQLRVTRGMGNVNRPSWPLRRDDEIVMIGRAR